MLCNFCMREIEESDKECPFCGKLVTYEAPTNHLKPGTVLRDRYLVGAALGEGGFGITYIGMDKTLKLKVAIKEYYPNGFANRNNTVAATISESMSNERKEFFYQGKEKFLSEAQILAGFSGKLGIVEVRDFFEENNTAYIVMEYLDGQTLKDKIKGSGNLPPQQVRELFQPIMLSLKDVHAKGIIHRDISPDNIMLVNDTAKLLDFGSARMFSDENRSLSILVKPGYAPLEQYGRKGKQGPWTDIYALCATLYKCITGITLDDASDRQISDQAKTPSALGIEIDEAFERALMKGLSVQYVDRFQSIDELLDGFAGKIRQSSDDKLETVAMPKNPDDYKKTEMMFEDDGKSAAAISGVAGGARTRFDLDKTEYLPSDSEENSPNNSNKKKKRKKFGAILGIVASAGVFLAAVIVGVLIIPRLSSRTESEIPGESSLESSLEFLSSPDDNSEPLVSSVAENGNVTVSVSSSPSTSVTQNTSYSESSETESSSSSSSSSAATVTSNPAPTPVNVNVTLNASGGRVSPDSLTVVSGESYGSLPTPVRNNYTFEGWYTSSSGGSRVYSDTIVGDASSVTLYARWKQMSIEVSLDSNGGSVSTSYITVLSGGTFGDLPTPYRDGYTFDGWYTARSGGDRVYGSHYVDFTSERTLYAHWTKNEETTVTIMGVEYDIATTTELVLRPSDEIGAPRLDNEAVKNAGKLKNLKKLQIGSSYMGCSVSSLKGLENLRYLEEIEIRCDNVYDLSPLEKLTKLKSILIYSNGIDFSTIPTSPSLTELYIGCFNIISLDNDGRETLIPANVAGDVKSLANITSLKKLNVQYPDLGTEEADYLKKKLPNCEVWAPVR